MKKILVPTDFSENASGALNHAIHIANLFGSKITLLHSYRVYSNTSMFISVESYMKEDAEKEMTKQVQYTIDQLKNGATVESHIIRGDAVSVITNISKQKKHDLIIMGTQGADRLQEVFAGSTTSGVIANTQTPVLAVPIGLTYWSFKQIVLAVDTEPILNSTILNPLLKLAKASEGHLSVFHLHNTDSEEDISPIIKDALEEVSHSFHYDFAGNHVNWELNEFATDKDADLICMIRHQRGFIQNLFHRSATRKELFHTHIPLLILQDSE